MKDKKKIDIFYTICYVTPWEETHKREAAAQWPHSDRDHW